MKYRDENYVYYIKMAGKIANLNLGVLKAIFCNTATTLINTKVLITKNNL